MKSLCFRYFLQTVRSFYDAIRWMWLLQVTGNRPVLLKTLIDEEWKTVLKKVERGKMVADSKKSEQTKMGNLIDFMEWSGTERIWAWDVNISYAERYRSYLSLEKGNGTPHTNKCLRWLKKILRQAASEERIPRFRLEGVNTNITYAYKDNHIELEELATLQKKRFRDAVQRIADLYVFCCYSGLAFSELRRFRHSENLFIDIDGREWINMYRTKKIKEGSAPSFHVPLFPEAKAILIKYNNELPIKVLQTLNTHLKEIQDVCDIKTNLTTHTARKTFGIIMMERIGFSLDATSYMLGHSDVKTTQKHYARVRMQSVKNELNKMAS